MQLHQLRYVVSVAEEHRFTRAAARLGVAQPSVSTAVRALERELGIDLFHRSGGAVTLTSAGEAFLPWARQALADCDAAQAAARDLHRLARGRLALGSTPSLTTTLLPPVLAGFARSFPGIHLVLHEAGSQNLVTDLGLGQLDMALVILPVSRSSVRTQTLYEEELGLAVADDHPLAGRTSVDVTDLEGTPLVMFRDGYDLRETTVAACRGAGFQPTFALDGLEMDGVLALTAAGLGAAVVPASVVSGLRALRSIPFRGTILRRTVGMAYRRDQPLTPAAEAFADQLRAAV